MPTIRERIENLPIVKHVLEQTKKLTLPGFDGVVIYDVADFFLKEIQRDVLTVRARSIAYSFFVALFPTILFFFTLIPYIPITGLQDNIMLTLREVLPENAHDFLSQTITDTIKRQHGGLLSIGLVLALFFSTNGMMGMMASFDKTNATFIRRSFWMKRLIALKLTSILFLSVLVSMVLIIMGDYFISLLLSEQPGNYNNFIHVLLGAVRYMIILALFFVSISFIYYYGPAVQKKWRFISAGSTLATLLTILFSIGFSFFVNNFATYNKLYGSIGTIIALLLWIYMNALALLIGFELNASIAYNKKLKDDKAVNDYQ